MLKTILFVCSSLWLWLPLCLAAESIETDKSDYAEGETITISWSKTGNAVNNRQLQLLASSDSPASQSAAQIWIKNCGTQSCTQKVKTGTYHFSSGPPHESQVQTWPLAAGAYKLYATTNWNEVKAGPVSITVGAASTLSTSVSTYAIGEAILVEFSRPSSAATTTDWIGIYGAGVVPDGSPPSLDWHYTCGGQGACPAPVASGQVSFSSDNLAPTHYDLYYLHADGYAAVKGPAQFTVVSAAPLCSDNIQNGDETGVDCGGSCSACAPGSCSDGVQNQGEGGVDCGGPCAWCPSPSGCTAAVTTPSSVSHAHPVEGSEVSRVAFSSCYKPANRVSNTLWWHLRNTFQAELFMWLGDNMYADGTNLESKRKAYNAARDDTHYKTHGPPATPKIPVVATWDDHDYAANNQGAEYACKLETLAEFATHFTLPSSDPRHPAQAGHQRKGVYHAHMFARPASAGGGNGLHVITLDVRSGRDPTFSTYGTCRGAATKLLSNEQWAWLDGELAKDSQIKIIGSGIQVLPPTDQTRPLSSYCAYDGAGNTFEAAISSLGESADSLGTSYESWAEVPQEREKLLRKCQKSIADGHAKHIIFVSGDQHWAEIMAMKVPASPTHGAEAVLHEVTASGIDQRWDFAIENSHRLRLRTADESGNGKFRRECNFPFVYQGTTYYACTTVDNGGVLWCSTQTDTSNNHVSGQWGNCLAVAEELIEDGGYSGEHIQTDNYFHVASAQANYGGIKTDWANNRVRLSIFTPHESTPEAAWHEFDMV